ncbi:MAG: cupin domain-containing protein [Chloroflexi bacterium]|nr:cupin domain-containing protein [Chloroflexota bacterium]
MFYSYGHQGFKVFEPAPGFSVRAISGRNVMLCDVALQPYSESPLHSHPCEELSIIIEGEFDMKIGDESQLLKKGDVYHVPPSGHCSRRRDSRGWDGDDKCLQSAEKRLRVSAQTNDLGRRTARIRGTATAYRHKKTIKAQK